MKKQLSLHPLLPKGCLEIDYNCRESEAEVFTLASELERVSSSLVGTLEINTVV